MPLFAFAVCLTSKIFIERAPKGSAASYGALVFWFVPSCLFACPYYRGFLSEDRSFYCVAAYGANRVPQQQLKGVLLVSALFNPFGVRSRPAPPHVSCAYTETAFISCMQQLAYGSSFSCGVKR